MFICNSDIFFVTLLKFGICQSSLKVMIIINLLLIGITNYDRNLKLFEFKKENYSFVNVLSFSNTPNESKIITECRSLKVFVSLLVAVERFRNSFLETFNE